MHAGRTSREPRSRHLRTATTSLLNCCPQVPMLISPACAPSICTAIPSSISSNSRNSLTNFVYSTHASSIPLLSNISFRLSASCIEHPAESIPIYASMATDIDRDTHRQEIHMMQLNMKEITEL